MKRSNTEYFAWSLFAVITIMATISLVYPFLAGGFAGQNIYTLAGDLTGSLMPVVFAFLAALIIARQPRNLIGWLLMGPALAEANSGGFKAFFGSFSSPPIAPSFSFLAALWFYNWSWLLLVFPVFLIFQLFPSGQPMSARWRWVARYVLGVGVYFFIIIAFSQPMDLQDLDWTVQNPVGFIPLDWIEQTGMVFFMIGLLSCTLLSAASLIVRYRRAAMLERTQIKWLLYACIFFALIYLVSILRNLQSSDWSFGSGLLYLLASLAFITIPAAIGIAILRYRLFDIDILIRRTLQYSILTGLLGLAYLGGVTVLQGVFTAVSGQQSPAALVLSTLAIAALFNPLRKRTQDFIDRRFYRQKYDAEKALAEFAAEARSETDLEQLTTSLLGVIDKTIKPVKSSLWIKKL